jgi:hypothetical protein
LQELYEDEQFRPYACILLYNRYEKINDMTKMHDYFKQLECYLDNDEVAKFLFKYYGNRLNYTDFRMKFFNLIKHIEHLKDSLMYNYYMYVAESYDVHFQYGREYLINIENRYLYLNPEYQQEWKEPTSDDTRFFEGIIKRNEKGLYIFKATDFQSSFPS